MVKELEISIRDGSCDAINNAIIESDEKDRLLAKFIRGVVAKAESDESFLDDHRVIVRRLITLSAVRLPCNDFCKAIIAEVDRKSRDCNGYRSDVCDKISDAYDSYIENASIDNVGILHDIYSLCEEFRIVFLQSLYSYLSTGLK